MMDAVIETAQQIADDANGQAVALFKKCLAQAADEACSGTLRNHAHPRFVGKVQSE